MVSPPGYHRASWLLELWNPVGLEASGLLPTCGVRDFGTSGSSQVPRVWKVRLWLGFSQALQPTSPRICTYVYKYIPHTCHVFIELTSEFIRKNQLYGVVVLPYKSAHKHK